MEFHFSLQFVQRQKNRLFVLLLGCALFTLQASALGSLQTEDKGANTRGKAHNELVTMKHGAFIASRTTRHAATGDEKAFRKFGALLCTHPDDTCSAAIHLLLDQAAKNRKNYEQVLQWAEKCFYQAPKWQAIYKLFLQHAVQSTVLSDIEKERPRYRLAQMELNSVGSNITDFRFVARSGDTLSLSQIKRRKANVLLLIDPHCRRCQQLVNSLSGNAGIQSGIVEGWLNMVAVNVDQDLPMWNMIKDYLPASWTIGYDITGLQGSDLYDLHLMPSVFLFGADQRVLFQNPDETTLINKLTSLKPGN